MCAFRSLIYTITPIIYATFVLVQITVVCFYSYLILYIRKPTLASNNISAISFEKQNKLTRALATAGLAHVSTNLMQSLVSLILVSQDGNSLFEIDRS
uniref:Uncharacterized protein n=1 Tax=Romanomermis culicivorax TaxID=13658 RepID=A0A915IB31_ROMCU